MRGGVHKAITRSAAKKMAAAALMNVRSCAAAKARVHTIVDSVWDEACAEVDVRCFKDGLEKLGWPATVAADVSQRVPREARRGFDSELGLHGVLFAVYCIKGGLKTSDFDDMWELDMSYEILEEVVRQRNVYGEMMIGKMSKPDRCRLLNDLYVDHYDAMKALWQANKT